MNIEINDPGNTKPINVLWAWIGRDSNGNDGILAAGSTPESILPMVSSDKKTLLAYEDLVRQASLHTGKTVSLVCFVRGDLQ